MKNFIKFLMAVVLIVLIVAQTGLVPQLEMLNFIGKNASSQKDSDNKTSSGITYTAKTKDKDILFYNNGVWKKTFLVGVNVGAGKPGIFPGELTITYDEYYRWFGYMSSMNINAIRVYTTLRPQFYSALLDFNKKAEKPLYLFQGVWVDENDIDSLNDVYASADKILNDFITDSKNIVDVIHGNITLPPRAGFASGNYSADVSPYVAGYVLGMEFDPKFVLNTNKSNPSRNKYEGPYLYTISASPFEAFLCNAGDSIISYETEKYKNQRIVSFTNWVTTDPLTHNNEPHPDEDLVEINVEHIKARDQFAPGMMATYHVYPYYPDSLNYQTDYKTYVDTAGKINPYRAYLHDLYSAHTMPIVVGEFGIPTSRGMTHKSIMGYNQGGVDETDQGIMLYDMMNSMYEENYSGGFLFAWQDEWFKRTWNNVSFDDPTRRPFWSNIQTCEQNFGILAFDPGEKTICNVDGETEDWAGDTPIIDDSEKKLYIKSDERYVYLLAQPKSYNFNSDTLLIPIDTKQNQGNLAMNEMGAKFDRSADFVISINGQSNSRILVDSYYDAFYYLYAEQNIMLPKNANAKNKNSGVFNQMNLCLSYEMTLPYEKKTIPFTSYETGLLKYGNANPQSPDYKSLSDFYYKDGNLEIRIPWQLLNVTDPSGKTVMDDFFVKRGITSTAVTDFYFGLGVLSKTKNIALSGTYTWNGWETPTYHERLKPSYYYLKEKLIQFNK